MLRIQRSGLISALEAHLRDLNTENFEVELDVRGYEREDAELEKTQFRIVQEALNNVVKHADAKRVKVSLQVQKGIRQVTVQDNGRGLDAAIQKAGHFGLKTMVERAEAQSGRLEVTSSPGTGTIVTVVVPLRQSR